MNFIGLSVDRFVDENTDYFCCIICSDIVINPKMCSICNHIFCTKCIDEWYKTKKYCPFKCSVKGQVLLTQIPNSVKAIYDNLKIKCSKENCDAIVPLSELFHHENTCGTHNCENHEKCGKTAPLMLIDERVCSEKCYIYTKLKKGEEISDEKIFQLMQNFSENFNDLGTIRGFYCFWEKIGEKGLSILDRNGTVANEASGKCYKSAVGAYVSYFYLTLLRR